MEHNYGLFSQEWTDKKWVDCRNALQEAEMGEEGISVGASGAQGGYLLVMFCVFERKILEELF